MSTGVLQSLAVIILPLAFPYAKKLYARLDRSKTATARPHTTTEIRQERLITCLAILYIFLISRELLSPETNIYRLTDSRLVTPVDVLRSRLSKLGQVRPESLWNTLQSREGVLLYLDLGEDSLENCRWCDPGVSSTFVLYSLGRIALHYLGHLLLLSLCTERRMLLSFGFSIAFGIEAHIRNGGLDQYNLLSKTPNDIWLVDSNAPIFRQCFVLSMLAIIRIGLYLSARFPTAQVNPNSIRAELLEAVEKIRASNSMQRTVVDDTELRSHMTEFWARNEEMAKAMDRDEEIIGARISARERMPAIRQEKFAALDHVEKAVTKSLPAFQ